MIHADCLRPIHIVAILLLIVNGAWQEPQVVLILEIVINTVCCESCG